MATITVCPKGDCKSTRFESVLQEIPGYRFKVNMIRCASCGAAVSAMEYLNIGATLETIAKKLNITL